jgi:hypothetical protein
MVVDLKDSGTVEDVPRGSRWLRVETAWGIGRVAIEHPKIKLLFPLLPNSPAIT